LIAAVFFVAVSLAGCGNSGTPNYGGGNGAGNSVANASETVPPDVPRNVK
jgi:hypothetical protein